MSAHKPSRTCRRVALVLSALIAAMAALVPAASATSQANRTRMHTLIARDVASVREAVAAAAGRVLGGLTSQGGPVVAELTAKGKRIPLVEATLWMRCASGRQFAQEDRWMRVPIGPHGSIRELATIPAQTLSSGLVVTGGSDTLIAKLDRKRTTLRGVWQLDVSVAATNGQTDQCDSGPVPFATRL